MPIFLSDEEFSQCSHDGALVADKADSYIRDLYNQLETVKAQADAASITAEQTCSMLEQKYVSVSGDFTALQSQHEKLNASLEQRLLEIVQLQADKRHSYLQSIEKDGEIERLNTEASEFHKSKRQLLELLQQKDIEISEKNIEAISSPQVGEDSKNEEGKIMEETVEPSDRSTGVADLAAVDVEQIATILDSGGRTSSSTAVTGVTDNGSIVAPAHDEVNQASPSRNRSPSVEQVSPANKSSTTINIYTRAREMSALRQHPQARGGSTSVARGRARKIRGRAPPRGF